MPLANRWGKNPGKDGDPRRSIDFAVAPWGISGLVGGESRYSLPMKIPPWWRIVLWSLVAVLGALAIGVLAWSRGEPVNALWMVVATGCVFAVSSRFHSAWLMAKVLTLDDQRATPAEIGRAHV